MKNYKHGNISILEKNLNGLVIQVTILGCISIDLIVANVTNAYVCREFTEDNIIQTTTSLLL